MKRQGRKPSQTDQAGLLQKLYYLMYLQVTSHKSTKLIPGIMSIRLVIYIRPNTIKIMLCIFSYLHVNKAEQTHSTDYLPCNKTLTKPPLNDVTLSLLEISKFNVNYFECCGKETCVYKGIVCPAEDIFCVHNHNSL